MRGNSQLTPLSGPTFCVACRPGDGKRQISVRIMVAIPFHRTPPGSNMEIRLRQTRGNVVRGNALPGPYYLAEIAHPALPPKQAHTVPLRSSLPCVVSSCLLLVCGPDPTHPPSPSHPLTPPYLPLRNVTPRAPPIAPADLTMAMHPDGDHSNSSPLLRQILQPLPETEDGTGTDRDREGSGDGDDAGAVGDGDGHGEGPNGNDDAVAENVVSIVDGMGLDENEAAALRLAIASGDANIRGALELFR